MSGNTQVTSISFNIISEVQHVQRQFVYSVRITSSLFQDANTLQQHHWWKISLCRVLPLCGISWSQLSGLPDGKTNTCVVRFWK